MKDSDIIKSRLFNQQIANSRYTNVQDLLSWMVAIQAQEFAMARWSIGLRLGSDNKGMPVLKDVDIETFFNSGKIIRTHLLRPTWHFVTPDDLRWLLALTGPRVNAANAFMYRKMELDASVFKRSHDIIVKALEGGKQLTRDSLKEALARKKIQGDGVRIGLLMMKAELDGLICSGARQGNQFTYALIDEWVPAAKPLTREEALTKLVGQYFTSRGPATLADFMTWSGVLMKDVRDTIASMKGLFAKEIIDGKEYFFTPAALENISSPASRKIQDTFLMPDYDEYGISYKDRSAIFDPKRLTLTIKGGNPVFNRMIVIRGKIAGTWRRTLKNGTAQIQTVPFVGLNKTEYRELSFAIKRFESFIETGKSKHKLSKVKK